MVQAETLENHEGISLHLPDNLADRSAFVVDQDDDGELHQIDCIASNRQGELTFN